MSGIIILQSPSFTLTSFHNGGAYELRNTATAQAVFLQGDDATEFRTQLDSMEKSAPEWDNERVLGELFNIYECVAADV